MRKDEHTLLYPKLSYYQHNASDTKYLSTTKSPTQPTPHSQSSTTPPHPAELIPVLSTSLILTVHKFLSSSGSLLCNALVTPATGHSVDLWLGGPAYSFCGYEMVYVSLLLLSCNPKTLPVTQTNIGGGVLLHDTQYFEQWSAIYQRYYTTLLL